MSVLKSEDGKELLIDCSCGCGNSIKVKVDDIDNEFYYYSRLYSANWYTEQKSCFSILKSKLKKIWRIIRNKDYCYSEICINKKEFNQFKEYINQF